MALVTVSTRNLTTREPKVVRSVRVLAKSKTAGHRHLSRKNGVDEKGTKAEKERAGGDSEIEWSQVLRCVPAESCFLRGF